MATLVIPTPLRKFTNGISKVDVEASTIKEAVDGLTQNFPELRKYLLDENDKIRTYVNFFVGDDDIRNLKNEETLIKGDTVVSIVPAIAGGII